MLGKIISFPNGFTSRMSIAFEYICNSNLVKFVNAATTWCIWKTKCNFNFRNVTLDFNSFPRKTFVLAKKYSTMFNYQRGKDHILSNFSHVEGPFLFWGAFCSSDLSLDLGFFIVGANHNISLARCYPISVSSELDVEVQALLIGLQCAFVRGIANQHIFIALQDLHVAF